MSLWREYCGPQILNLVMSLYRGNTVSQDYLEQRNFDEIRVTVQRMRLY